MTVLALRQSESPQLSAEPAAGIPGRNLSPALILGISRSLALIAKHAASVGEEVIYLRRGDSIRPRRTA
jgi:hypothetical protein